jgi:hypothetical protein
MLLRSELAKATALDVKAFYSISTLAAAGNVSYYTLRRLLENNGVTFVRSKRAIVVSLSEVRSRLPWFWDSLVAIETLRAEAASRLSSSDDR